jgi:hypothetical protein
MLEIVFVAADTLPLRAEMLEADRRDCKQAEENFIGLAPNFETNG